jgi:hypothetical protein
MPGSPQFQMDQAFRDSLNEFNMGLSNNFHAFQMLGNPALQGMIRAGVMQGQSLGQDMQASLGSLSGGSSGVGAISRSLANSFAANNAAQARMQFTNQNLQMALQGLGFNQNRQLNTPIQGPLGQAGSLISAGAMGLSQLIPGIGQGVSAIKGMFSGGPNMAGQGVGSMTNPFGGRGY